MFTVSANNVSALTLSTTGATSVTLSTTDKDLTAFLNKEADVSTSDGLVKIADGVYQFTGATATSGKLTFSNNQIVDIKDLKVTGLSSVTAGATTLTLDTSEAVSIEKLGGDADVSVTGTASKPLTVTMDGDTAEGIDFGTAKSFTIKDGTTAVKAGTASTLDVVTINNIEATTASEVANIAFTVAAEDLVKSISLKNTAQSAIVTLSTTDSTTAQALRDAGITENSNGTFTWQTGAPNELSTLDFGSGINLKSLSFSDVSKNTTSNDQIYIETTGTVTIANDEPSWFF